MRANISIIILSLYFIFAHCSPGSKKSSMETDQSLLHSEQDSLIDRRPAVAGSFYPGNKDELLKELQVYYTHAVPGQKYKHIVAIIAPHAGYVFSGQVAASAYNQLDTGFRYKNIFVIGSSHHASYDGASIYTEGNFITPLGTAKVNLFLAKELVARYPKVFHDYPDVQRPEHSLEVQLPFLQYHYKDQFTFVPILLGTQNVESCKQIAEALKPYLDGDNLFVISTDFSHYPDYEDACRTDKITAQAIEENSVSAFLEVLKSNERKGTDNLLTSICGWTSMLSFLYMTQNNPQVHFHLIQYMNSGDTPYGDKQRVVGYNGMVVTLDSRAESNTQKNKDEAFSLSQDDKEKLLELARITIKTYLETGKVPSIEESSMPAELRVKAGAFVTLRENKELRGCIGRFTSEEPLYQVVQDMAIASSTRDTRFDPLTLKELPKITIEISVLTPMRKIESINEIQLGRHGIYIKKGMRGGTFLPQVARETGWTLEEFLGHCAQDKAGLGWDGWKDADIYVYEAYAFAEGD